MKQNLSEQITNPLEQLRGGIRRFVIWDGLLVAALIVVLGYWLGLAFDYGSFKLLTIDWVLDAPKWVRVLGLIVFASLLAACVAYLWYYRLTRTFSYPSLALVLEKRFPNLLGDRLITAVELADVEKAKKDGYSEEMVRDVISDAHQRIKQVPIDSVFNWARLRKQAWLLGGIAVGLFALVFIGYMAITRTFSPMFFGYRFSDVSQLWAGRNLLLNDTPWPRRAHIELQQFPESGDLRIGKDAPSPTIRVRTYQWVVADKSTRFGWRPLTVADAQKITGLPIPDEKMEAVIDDISPEKHAELFAKLQTYADEATPRTIRKLNIPDVVTLRYAGQSTRGTIQLNQEKNNEFSGEIAGLKESIQFFVKGDDFASDTKKVTLVPPPMLLKLSRDELVPAYMYHPAPNDNFSLLKGLKHQFLGKEFSLTGEKSTCVVLTGSEINLTGTADKELKEVRITAKTGNVPGTKVGDATPLVLKPSDGKSFSLSFQGESKLNQSTEFDITLVDQDDVTNTRTVAINVTDDQPPVVEIGVDILRKRGNEYLCTPSAYVPFSNESFVRDDYALSKVQFVYNYTEVNSKEVVVLQTQLLASLWADSPLAPGTSNAFAKIGSIILTNQMLRSNRKLTDSVDVPRFKALYSSLPKITTDLLKQRLGQQVDFDRPDVVKEVKFPDDTTFFDLREYLKKLRNTDPSGVQPQYRVELNVVATDTNYDSGPKVGQALEPIRLLVMSEADLLAEISKDEEGLINKLDDTIKKLKAAQSKLTDLGDRLTASNPQPDLVISASVRSNDIAQDISKAKDQGIGILTEYKRLFKELEVNRCNNNVVDRYITTVIAPLEEVNNKQFVAAEDSHKVIVDELAANRVPVPLVITNDKTALAELIFKLDAIRASLGDALSIQKQIEALNKIIEGQKKIRLAAEVFRKGMVEQLLAPEIQIAGPFKAAKDSSVAVKLPIDWKVYDKGDIAITITTPDGITGPGTITVKDDQDNVSFTLKTTSKTGDFKIKVKPAIGKTVEIVVSVQ